MQGPYQQVATVSSEAVAALEALAKIRGANKWILSANETFRTRMLSNEEIEGIEFPFDRVFRARFIEVFPGGHVRKHTDEVGVEPPSFHVVVSTNDKCVNHVWKGDVKESHHLEQGGVYAMDHLLPHESFNRGETTRLHVLLEVHKED